MRITSPFKAILIFLRIATAAILRKLRLLLQLSALKHVQMILLVRHRDKRLEHVVSKRHEDRAMIWIF